MKQDDISVVDCETNANQQGAENLEKRGCSSCVLHCWELLYRQTVWSVMDFVRLRNV